MEQAPEPASEISYYDLINYAYSDDPDDAEAAREEASLKHSRRQLLHRSTEALKGEEEIFYVPPPPCIVHLRSPRVVYEEGAARLPEVVMVEEPAEGAEK